MKCHHIIDLCRYNCFDVREGICFRIGLHDCVIDQIESDEKGVYFHFPDGFNVLSSNGKIKRTGEAIVVLKGCSINDIDFKFCRRFCLFHHYIEINTLQDFANSKKWKKLELIDEFYTFNQLCWKLEVYPNKNKKLRLSPMLEITTDEISCVEYYWKE